MSTASKSWRPEPGLTDHVDLSIIVPIYNERAVLPMLYGRLRRVLDPLEIGYELVLVDDGTGDFRLMSRRAVNALQSPKTSLIRCRNT